MRDFWLSSGHHLLDRDDGGGLVVTDEFLKAYLARPELTPPEEACDAERHLHTRLMASPRVTVIADDIAAIADPDARDNWRVLVDFRDHLLASPTLEAAYLALIRHGTGRTPPLFIDQIVHLILRNALDGCDDPFVLRAAEMFFRPQRLTLHEGSLIAADEELIAGTSPGPVSPLVSILGLAAASHIDVIGEHNAQQYWPRSDRFDMAIDLTTGRRGLGALAQVISRWLAHLHGVSVEVSAISALTDARLTWYVGLDAEGSRIGDRLWHGEAIDEATRARVISLFSLRFLDPDVADARLGGEPVYLILTMTPDKVLRMKPQNLVTGLPLTHLQGSDMSAPLLSLCVGVVIERRKAKSAWIDFVWRPVAVLPGIPEAQPWSLLEENGEATRFYAGTAMVQLYRPDVPRYLENLNSGAPALWVVLRPTGAEPPYDIAAVTANPSEGEAFTEAGADIVETVPMTEYIATEIAEFVAANPAAEEVFYKRKQQRADPDALARHRPRGAKP